MADRYTIISQTQVLDTRDVTNPQQAMLITFRTPTQPGPFSVTIPLTQYSAQSVHDAITEYVGNIEDVSQH